MLRSLLDEVFIRLREGVLAPEESEGTEDARRPLSSVRHAGRKTEETTIAPATFSRLAREGTPERNR